MMMEELHSLGLEGAAKILRCSKDTVRDKAAAGEIPGVKIGREWVFIDADLYAHIRAKYGSKGVKQWRSGKEAKSGGSTFKSEDSELERLLG